MKLLDSRRLTGPNVLWDRPGAVLDVTFEGADRARVIATWRSQVKRMLTALDWGDEQVRVRELPDGASLAISAPVDTLYAATEINDWAWEAASHVLAGDDEPALEPDATRLRARIQEESNPALQRLIRAARDRDLPCLYDDDAVSVGLGTGSQTWLARDLPKPADVKWDALHTIPVALVTGTNGKTTSVRLAAAIAQSGGYSTGISSTDWLSVNGEVMERGDYSGPGGARTVLRDRRVALAILETARGGLLRRGLGLLGADAALITNIAADHLGDFGGHDVPALADIKWVVTRALGPTGTLVLNADDELLVERGLASNFTITWFSTDASNEIVRNHVSRGGTACIAEQGCVTFLRGEERNPLMRVADIPITLGGTALHNVSNVLGVVGLVSALGLPFDAIVEGLRRMRPQDNPGRGNLLQIDGVDILVDFAHNPHGLEAIARMVRSRRSGRRLLVIGQAGDRDDEAIRGLVRAAWAMDPDRIVVKEMARYRRGRAPGEIPAIIYDEFMRLGCRSSMIERSESELGAVRTALESARPGDLLILLIHENASAVMDYLTGRSAT